MLGVHLPLLLPNSPPPLPNIPPHAFFLSMIFAATLLKFLLRLEERLRKRVLFLCLHGVL